MKPVSYVSADTFEILRGAQDDKLIVELYFEPPPLFFTFFNEKIRDNVRYNTIFIVHLPHIVKCT